MHERTEAAYWEGIKPKDLVTLKDEQTLQLILEEGLGNISHGVDLTVKTVYSLTERQGLVKWSVCELEAMKLKDGEGLWYLVVKIVDEEFDLKVMFIPDDFEPGRRGDLVESGSQWVFQAPENEDDYELGDLEFAREIDQTVEDQTIWYRQKPQGVLYGEVHARPGLSGTPASQFAVIVEYRADQECDNPELLLLELGGVVLPDYSECETERQAREAERRAREASGEGGYLLLLQGTTVGLNDVELMPT